MTQYSFLGRYPSSGILKKHILEAMPALRLFSGKEVSNLVDPLD
jgi:hypothetical protein